MATQISNGTTVPHATDYSDLLAKLKTFALANGWTSLEDTSDKLVLQGEGAGTDEIVVAFQKYSDVPSDSYGWYINGYSGYTSGLTFANQPGALPNWSTSAAAAYPAMPLWNSTIPYWLVVSGRRIIVVAKVSTTYQMCYAGWFLPFASPGQYPYPMMIGGSQSRTSASSIPRYSATTAPASMFWSGRDASPPTLMLRAPDGSWNSVINNVNAGIFSTESQIACRGIFPYNSAMNDAGFSPACVQQALDGSAVLTPLMWTKDSRTSGFRGHVGEIDGVYHVSGNSHAAEDIVTVSGDSYLVVQDVFRTAVENYCAVKLV